MKLPRINAYQCEYGCNVITVDVDHGVTPFMIGCRRRSTKERPIQAKYLNEDGFCIGTGKSCFYPKAPLPPHLGQPTWEWYRPSEEDLAKMSKREADHYRRHPNELALRERTDREPIYHSDSEEKSE